MLRPQEIANQMNLQYCPQCAAQGDVRLVLRPSKNMRRLKQISCEGARPQ